MMKAINHTASRPKQATTLLQRQAVLPRSAFTRPRAAVRHICAAAAVQEAPSAKRAAKVSFQLEKHVDFGEEVCLVGEQDLGGWDAQAAVCLSWHDGDVWTAECELPTGSHIEYKYIIRKPSGEVVQWQPIPTNLELDVPESATLTVVDAWDSAGRCDITNNNPNTNNASAHSDGNAAVVTELPRPEPLVSEAAADGADDGADDGDVVPAYLDDDVDELEWDGGASGGAANGILEATMAVGGGSMDGVVRGGGAGKRGVVVASAAMGSVEGEGETSQGEAAGRKGPRTSNAAKRELKAHGKKKKENKNDLFGALRQAMTGDE